MTAIWLPFPASSLAGHNTGHWSKKKAIVAKHREWARTATLSANPAVPSEGDIPIRVDFHPPNRRGDPVNYPIRMKPFFDGIADALGINDRRFIPEFRFLEPVKPGHVLVIFGEAA